MYVHESPKIFMHIFTQNCRNIKKYVKHFSTFWGFGRNFQGPCPTFIKPWTLRNE